MDCLRLPPINSFYSKAIVSMFRITYCPLWSKIGVSEESGLVNRTIINAVAESAFKDYKTSFHLKRVKRTDFIKTRLMIYDYSNSENI